LTCPVLLDRFAEVICKLSGMRTQVVCMELLEKIANASVEIDTLHSAELVIDRVAQEYVSEPQRTDPIRSGKHQTRIDCRLDQGEQLSHRNA
jgi:hypothetical protein